MQDKQDNGNTEKSRNYIKYAFIVLICLVVILVFLLASQPPETGSTDTGISSGTMDSSGEYYNNNDSDDGPGEENMENVDNFSTSIPLIKVNTDPASYTVLVNREYPMPGDYVPDDLMIPKAAYSYEGIYEKSYMRKAAAKAIEKMFAEAKKSKKYEFKVVSAYRSYTRQKAIYENNVNTRGSEKTNKVSAQPGCSEHQTGLAIDVSCETVNCAIDKTFASCPEGKWLAKNCHKFGFIIRYPKGKSDITGYSYEPWHIRYVGVNLAKYLHKKDLTLEEYYMVTTVDDKVPEDEYIKDTDIGAPKEPQMTAAPTPATTAYAAQSAIPVPEPTDTPAPTARPEKTKEPVRTKEPVNTSKPEYTKEPEETKEPAKTKEPVKTPKPSKSPVPVKTKEPVKTPLPSDEPGITEPPYETEPPQEDTPEPSGTAQAAEDSQLEETSVPDGSGEME